MGVYKTTRGRRRHHQTRERLLKSAKSLFLLNGLHPVTVDDICLAAGVSKGGFYHHFPNKECVFLSVALEILASEAAPGVSVAGGRAASGLLIELWAWAKRRPPARHRVRALHQQAFMRLCGPSGNTERERLCGVDREAQAALAVFMGIGGVVQQGIALGGDAGERARETARSA